jgi:phage-related protein
VGSSTNLPVRGNAPRPGFSILSVVANIERHRLASGEPWILLLQLMYPGSADPTAQQQWVTLARNDSPVTFDCGDGLGPQVYQPFNFDVGEYTLSSKGDFPELEVKASNVLRILQNTVEQYGGVVGANLNLYVVNAANPAGEPDLAMAFTVKQTICDAKLVTFKCGATSPLRRLFPLLMYRVNFCGWVYNSPALQARAAADPTFRNPGKQCGYIGPLPTCSHTIDGATGCQAHFPGQVLRGCFFPGIDTNGAAVASVA